MAMALGRRAEHLERGLFEPIELPRPAAPAGRRLTVRARDEAVPLEPREARVDLPKYSFA